jgi:glucose/arabinose dehydrogenase
MLIWQNQIFVSYTDEIKEDCWNTSVIIGDIDYENINFKKLYSADECVHSVDNVDKIFNAHQSGGRIIPFKNDTILLTVGDYRSRHLAQNKESVNGKIIKIDINKNNYEIVSMGHRNPQGLYFDKDNNIIIETEHGPNGGDEINLINVSDIENKEIPNYGWAISSAGEHYGGRSLENKKIYEKYPLHKSHSEHGFIEPLKSFVPSIAISEIVKVGTDNYVVGSMGKNRDGDKSLYFFDLENKRISNLEQVKVFERIRDLKFYDNKLYLFMEDTASIGIINLD